MAFMCHSDAGTPYISIDYAQTLELEDPRLSIGSVEVAFDNAAAKTIFGLFKVEDVVLDSPFRVGPRCSAADSEILTMHRVY